MKRLSPVKLALASICAISLAAAVSARADTIATWSFEAGQNSALVAGNVTAASTGPIASDVGTGSFTGVHANAATVWSAPAGDANAAYPSSVHASSANTWQVGDYFQFTVNPNLGSYAYSGIGLSWDQTGSNTGPKNFGVYYSTDGTTFTQLGSDYALAFASWTTTVVAANHESADFSAITALNTASTMYFRIEDDSTTAINSVNAVATAGTGRIDNFTITANLTEVPEPASLSLLGGFGLLAWTLLRRRK